PMHSTLSLHDALPISKSGVTLRLDEGTRLEFQGDCRLEKIQYSGDQRTVKMTRGLLRATVARQAARKLFVFQTPHAEVTVLGTRDRKSTRLNSSHRTT